MEKYGLLLLPAFLWACSNLSGATETVKDVDTETERERDDDEAGDEPALVPGGTDEFPYSSTDGEFGADNGIIIIGLPEDAASFCECPPEDGLFAIIYMEEECFFVSEKTCTDHDGCNDHVYCNTEERCGRFLNGPSYCYTTCCPSLCNPCEDPPDGDGTCHPGVCLEEQKTCLYPLKDTDRDGYGDESCEGGTDCNDNAPGTHPGVTDICDNNDNNCNDIKDEDGWREPSGGAASGLLSTVENNASHHTIVSLGNSWQAAWLETDPDNKLLIKFAVIDGESDAEPSIVHGPFANEETIGNLSIIGSAPDFYIVWSETGSGGSRIVLKNTTAGALDHGRVLFSSTDITSEIDDVTAKNAHASNSRAGIFFKMAIGGDSGNFEIFYLPVADFTVPLPVAGELQRLTESIEFSGHPDANAIPEGWMVVWDDERDGDREIYLTKIDLDGSPLLDFPVKVTSSPGDSQEPKIACLGEPADECAIVWTDERYGNFAIFSTIADLSGRIDSPEISITEPAVNAWYPSIIPDGERGQFSMTYAASARPNYSDIHLNFLSSRSSESIDGRPVEENDAKAIEPLLAAVSGASNKLALIWKEVDLGGSSIHYQILACE